MRKIYLSLALASAFFMSSAFAHEGMMHSKSCEAIANACHHAGYERKGHKKFWMECMKPVIMGQSVKGVNISSDTVKACRTDKITELKSELNKLENTSN